MLDLKGGVAVHGIAGNRGQYAPVRHLYRNNQPADGDPLALLDWYRRFQLRRFYIADIDALQHGVNQQDVIARLLAHSEGTDEWVIDAGVRENCMQTQTTWMRETTTRCPRVHWIIASESARSEDLIRQVAEQVDASSLVLGLDFRSGQFVGPETGCESWLRAADRVGVSCGLVLDVAAVGTAAGPQTIDHCSRMSECYPDWRWTSGGGCRDLADVALVLGSGCDGCLIASALLPS